MSTAEDAAAPPVLELRGVTVRFGSVPGFDGPALAAPEMPAAPLRARGRVR